MPQPALVLADLVGLAAASTLIAAVRQDDRFASLPVAVLPRSDAAAPQGFRRVKEPIELDDLLRIVSSFCQRRM
jgi:hypothetical protein